MNMKKKPLKKKIIINLKIPHHDFFTKKFSDEATGFMTNNNEHRKFTTNHFRAARLENITFTPNTDRQNHIIQPNEQFTGASTDNCCVTSRHQRMPFNAANKTTIRVRLLAFSKFTNTITQEIYRSRTKQLPSQQSVHPENQF